MPLPLMLIPAALSAGMSIYDLFRLKGQNFKMSPEEEEALGNARRLAREGLTAEQENAMRTSLTIPAQHQLASAFASRGTGNSSEADQGLVDLFGRVGGEIAQADTRAMMSGQQLFGQMSSEIANARRTFDMMKENATAEAWSTLGESLGTGFSELEGYFNPEETDWEKYWKMDAMVGSQQPLLEANPMTWLQLIGG